MTSDWCPHGRPSSGTVMASKSAVVKRPEARMTVNPLVFVAPLPPSLVTVGNLAHNWKAFRRTWMNYEAASKLKEQDSAIRKATFLACLGEEAMKILHSLKFENDNDYQNVDVIWDKLEKHCLRKTSVTYERFCFNQRKQEHGETIDKYVSVLRVLVRSCNYDSQDEALRDRMLLGIIDKKAQQRLLEVENLDLEQCISICKGYELMNEWDILGEMKNKHILERPTERKSDVCLANVGMISYDKGINQKSTPVQHNVVHATDSMHVCVICKKDFSTSSAVQVHLLSHGTAELQICSACGAGFSTAADLAAHILIHLNTNSFLTGNFEAQSTTDTGRSVPHPGASLDIPSVAAIDEAFHGFIGTCGDGLDAEHIDQIQPVIGSAIAKGVNLSKRSESPGHSAIGDDSDSGEVAGTVEYSDEDTHESAATPVAPEGCRKVEKCNEGEASGIVGRSSMDTDATEHACSKCHRQFQTKKKLKLHIDRCRRYICTECGAVFCHSEQLKAHGITHMGKNNFQCTCGKQFSRYSDLRRHKLDSCDGPEMAEKRKSGIKPYACSQCPRRFAYKSYLKWHVQSKACENPGEVKKLKDVASDKVKGKQVPSKDTNQINIYMGMEEQRYATNALDTVIQLYRDGESEKCQKVNAEKSDNIEKQETHARIVPIDGMWHGGEGNPDTRTTTDESHGNDGLPKIVITGEGSHLDDESKPADELDTAGNSKLDALPSDVDEADISDKAYSCRNCRRKFKTKINLMHHTKLKSCVHVCAECGALFKYQSHLDSHMVTHTDEKPHKCTCGKQYTRYSTLKQHRLVTGCDGPEREIKHYECSKCFRRFVNMAGLKSHMQSNSCIQSHSSPVSNKVRTKDLKDKSYKVTGEKPDDEADKPKAIAVFDASAAVDTKNFHKKQIMTEENNQINISTDMALEEQFQVTKEHNTVNQSHECMNSETYQKINREKSSRAEKHELCHTSRRAYIDAGEEISGTETYTVDDLGTDGPRKIDETSYIDEAYAGEELNAADNSEANELKRHDEPVMVEKPDTRKKAYKCSKCYKEYQTENKLMRHIESNQCIHNNNICTECGRVFRDGWHLAHHVATHTGKKPHKCACGKQYTRSADLKRHKLTSCDGSRMVPKRSGIKPYVCCKCGTRFAFKSGLKRHMRRDSCPHSTISAVTEKEVLKEVRNTITHRDTEGKPVQLERGEIVEAHDSSTVFTANMSHDKLITKEENNQNHIKVNADKLDGAENHEIGGTDRTMYIDETWDDGEEISSTGTDTLEDLCTNGSHKMDETSYTHAESNSVEGLQAIGNSEADNIKPHEVPGMFEEADAKNTSFSCSKCNRKYQTKNNLLRHFESKQCMRNICTECGKVFSDGCHLAQHMATHTGKKTHKCVCGKQYTRSADLKRHKLASCEGPEMVQKRASMIKPYVCTQCDRRFSYKSTLKLHKQSSSCIQFNLFSGTIKVVNTAEAKAEHSYMVVNENPKREGEPEIDKDLGTVEDNKVVSRKVDLKEDNSLEARKKYECTICNKRYVSLRYLKEHMFHHTGLVLACTVCPKTFSSQISLKAHIKNHMVEKERSHKCTCGKAFQNETLLKLHYHVHTNERPHVCVVCEKRFKTKLNLKVHSKSHLGAPEFICHHCGKGFHQRYPLKMHMTRHSNENSFTCPICFKSFVSAAGLKTHSNIHTGMKKYVCDICGKAFAQSAGLNAHKLVHTGDRAHKCGECDRAYATASRLRKHVMIHTGEKPYKCEECGRGFREQIRLRNHMFMHTGKPHVCDVCGKSFTLSRSLMVHSYLHTGNKPHPCQHCDKRYNTTGELKKHQAVHLEENKLGYV